MEGIPFASNGEVTSAEVVGGNPDSPTDGAGVDVAIGTTETVEGVGAYGEVFGATKPNEGVVFERVAGVAESMENLETSE